VLVAVALIKLLLVSLVRCSWFASWPLEGFEKGDGQLELRGLVWLPCFLFTDQAALP
jgi:hypothetical protein